MLFFSLASNCQRPLGDPVYVVRFLLFLCPVSVAYSRVRFDHRKASTRLVEFRRVRFTYGRACKRLAAVGRARFDNRKAFRMQRYGE